MLPHWAPLLAEIQNIAESNIYNELSIIFVVEKKRFPGYVSFQIIYKFALRIEKGPASMFAPGLASSKGGPGGMKSVILNK